MADKDGDGRPNADDSWPDTSPQPSPVPAEIAAAARDSNENHARSQVLPPGSSIGRYVIIGKLGAGGMSIVYRAYDPKLDRQVALKLLQPERRTGNRATAAGARLLREAQALAQLAHPNVIAVFDVGTIGDSVYVAMELVDGENLRAWLADAERSLPEIVDVFVAAAHGLAAAHTAGLVHRDFKPANVIVGLDGRVRVLDFGLARGTGPDEVPTEEESDSRSSSTPGSNLGSRSQSGLADRLTRVGAVVGTPAYMAPEQHYGRPVDAKTDQFGFCISLYEAIYGQRPFRGATRAELGRNTLRGKIAEPPPDRRVPAWLRQIVFRGLSSDPDDRYPTMDALIAELCRDRRARKQRIAAAILAAALATLAIFGLVRNTTSPSRLCTGGKAKLAGKWDRSVRRQMLAAFQNTGRPHAAETFAHAARVLNGYAASWVKMQAAACRATHVTGEQSAQLLDLRMRCLNRHLDKLEALTSLLASAKNASRMDDAIDAAYELPDLAACSDEDALTAPIAPPPADIVDAVGRIKGQIDRAEALSATGDYTAARAIARSAAAEASGLGYRPLEAETLYLLGDLHANAGAPGDAELALRKAIDAAAHARDDALVARCWIMRARTVGYRLARFDEGLYLAAAASVAIVRAGDSAPLRADLLDVTGLIRWSKGERRVAHRELEESLELRERLLGSEHPAVARSHNSLGMLLSSAGHYDDALDHHELALAIRQKAYGDEHPYVADSLNNMGAVLYHKGEHARAKLHYERALAIRARALGADHLDVGTSHNNLGGVYQDMGDLGSARRSYRRALSIWERTLGPLHPDLAIPLSNLGELANLQQEPADALAFCGRALAIEEASRGSGHPSLAYNLTCIGEAHLGANHNRLALPILERALELRLAHEVDPSERARTRFALARALWQTGGDRRRAIRLARTARDACARAGDHMAKRVKRIDRWLASR